MTDHDPLCSPDDIYSDADHEDEFCHCELVARVRADERRQFAETIRADERERIAQEIEANARYLWTLGTDWVAVAARIARGEQP